MEERVDQVMTDYQMRTILRMVAKIIGSIVKDPEERKKIISELVALGEGKLDDLLEEPE